VRSRDLLAVAGHVARTVPQLLSLEAWGGATYDVALRYLHEDPWERLAALSEAVPNVCLQMLLRGRNTVGYTPYPLSVRDRSVEATEKTAGKAGRSIPGHVPAPFVGTVTLQVTEGSAVTAGQVIATIEAMKMEAAITAPLDGTVARLAIKPVQPVEGGDLLLVVS
jgi:pyruvate carboxylase